MLDFNWQFHATCQTSVARLAGVVLCSWLLPDEVVKRGANWCVLLIGLFCIYGREVSYSYKYLLYGWLSYCYRFVIGYHAFLFMYKFNDVHIGVFFFLFLPDDYISTNRSAAQPPATDALARDMPLALRQTHLNISADRKKTSGAPAQHPAALPDTASNTTNTIGVLM